MPQVIDRTNGITPDIKQKDRSQQHTKNQPLYGVILHNDPINTIEYVVQVLRKIFGYGLPKAIYLTLKVHFQGKAIIWTGHREYAEMKAEQIKMLGPDPSMIHKGANALQVTVEKLP